jgi:DNA-binding LacI/PurR family transcriptional regulator
VTTISDVAQAAGVSEATVSRVLNRPEIVAEEKRRRVLSAIEQLKFEPSLSARTLRLKSFRNVALLVGDISQPFHGRMAKAVEAAAEEHGYSVTLGDLDNSEGRLLGFLQALPKRGVDGVLLSTAADLDRPVVRDAIEELRRQGIPLVTTSQSVSSMGVPSVLEDIKQVGKDAANHLIARGDNLLVLIGGGNASAYSRILHSGVREAVREAVRETAHGKASLKIVNGRYQHEPARKALARLLLAGYRPDGIVTANTPMAIGAIRALKEAGLTVPGDVAVVSCEDVPDAQFILPSITSVGTDMNEYGAQAFGLLLRIMSGNVSHEDCIIPHELIVRESSLHT